jgi:transcription antitermination factor NusG
VRRSNSRKHNLSLAYRAEFSPDAEKPLGLTMRELYSSSSLYGGAASERAASFEDTTHGHNAVIFAQATSPGPSLAWHALSVKHQHERAIEAALIQKGFEAFSPVFRSRRQWSDRTKEIELPLFAGYVFCRFAYEAMARIVSLPAVSRVVEFGGKPAVVPDAEIAAVRAVVDSKQPLRPWPHLKPGDRVRVEKGPLRGVEGILLKEKDAVELIVSVELLQRSVAVQVDAMSVVPLARALRCTA